MEKIMELLEIQNKEIATLVEAVKALKELVDLQQEQILLLAGGGALLKK